MLSAKAMGSRFRQLRGDGSGRRRRPRCRACTRMSGACPGECRMVSAYAGTGPERPERGLARSYLHRACQRLSSCRRPTSLRRAHCRGAVSPWRASSRELCILMCSPLNKPSRGTLASVCRRVSAARYGFVATCRTAVKPGCRRTLARRADHCCVVTRAQALDICARLDPDNHAASALRSTPVMSGGTRTSPLA